MTLEDVPGRPPTPEDSSGSQGLRTPFFCQSSLATQISVARGWPAAVSARKLALLSDRRRKKVLSHLPLGLAKEIIALMPVVAG